MMTLSAFLPHRPYLRQLFATERKELRNMSFVSVIGIGFLALCVMIQFLFLCWCNLTQWPSHLDNDSSTQILKVLEIAKAGSLSLPNWNDTTSLLLDTPLTLAAVLLPLFRDPFIAYAVAVILLLAAFIYVSWQLLRRLNCPLPVRLLTILLLLCPYSYEVVLGYANCMLVQSAHYLMRVLYLLYLLYSLVTIEQREVGPLHLLTWLFTLGLGAWIALSSGLFLLLLALLPVVCGYIVRALAASRPRLLRSPGMAFLLLNLLAFAGGTFVQRNVIHFASRDASIAWNSYSAFFTNLESVLQGWLKLTGALPSVGGVVVLSYAGIAYGISFLVSLGLLSGLLFCLLRIARAPAAACHAASSTRGLAFACLLGIIALNLLVLTGGSLAYGESIYESRYLIFLLIAVILLLVLCLPWLQRVGGLYAPVIALFSLLTVGNAVACNTGYLAHPTYDFHAMQAVTNTLDAAYPDVRVVYMLTNDHDRRILRVVDPSKVYRLVSGDYISGDYTYYSDGSGLDAGTLLLATDSQYANMDPALAASFKKTDLDPVWLYMDQTGYSTNDPQPYGIYYCSQGGIDLTSLPSL